MLGLNSLCTQNGRGVLIPLRIYDFWQMGDFASSLPKWPTRGTEKKEAGSPARPKLWRAGDGWSRAQHSDLAFWSLMRAPNLATKIATCCSSRTKDSVGVHLDLSW